MEVVGVLWEVATCLFSSGKVHASYVYKLEKNLASLQEKWVDLQNIRKDLHRRIDDAEETGEMKRTEEVNGWLEKVQKLEEVMEEIQNQGSLETHNKCLSGCCPKNCVSSYKLGKRVVAMLREVDGLSEKRLVDIAYNLHSGVVDEMPYVETIGLDLMLNRVWNTIEDKNVNMIGLYGMGGAGKTTLMKRIHGEFGKRQHNFDIVLWVVVSRYCDIDKIMDSIRKSLGINDYIWDKRNPDERVATIYRVLKTKKFVLMLDDLWGELELEKVGVPHPKDTNNHSKVLFTTRNEDVCAKMQAGKKFEVERLGEQEAFELFCKMVGEETLRSHTDIQMLAWDIAKLCKGLPLALVTVGRAMSGVKSVAAWSQAMGDLTRFSFIGLKLEKDMFRILTFSYDRLPDETHKSCFLYCALYPKDYEVEVKDLIDRWIGEGFLGKGRMKKSIYDMYEEGESIIEKLKLSCLLEGVEDYRNGTFRIKMHDVIRDMALWLARDGDRNKDKVVVEGEALGMSEMDFERLNDVERISIINAASGSWQVPSCPNLLTLCVRGDDVNITDFSNLESMTRLKVLDLSDNDIDHPLTEIKELMRLEYLNLSFTKIRNGLQIGWKNLKMLRVLLMEYLNCNIISLKEIESLKQLKVFRLISYFGSLSAEEEKALLEKLECLPKLEELCIELRTTPGLHKLLESNKLRDCLRRFLLRSITSFDMASFLASGMKHLEWIDLREIENIKESSPIADTFHLPKLRQVQIVDCQSITHLTWLRYAPLLEYLYVANCDSIEEVVKEAEDDRDNSNDIFPNLRHLSLNHLPKLKSIHKRALAFPSLEFIAIGDCRNLRTLFL
ncbi:probable disease resistance protein At5g63020 [Gastrolobium bilobum]|uniref:probable disease resistance protein At5g63020 n=1 Tax=Gastrolobium bilobum TaxID=150636 RepID=UPI002AB03191|nr:probable disease resistance protein At5g63020 [Gastrolobium bilobum]